MSDSAVEPDASHAAGPGLEIPTRQKSDVLFETREPLPSGTRLLRIMRVEGYSEIEFFGVASGVFTASVQEGCTADGPFVQTLVITSSPSAGEQRICERYLHCGAFMRVVIAGAPLAALEFAGQGVPLP